MLNGSFFLSSDRQNILNADITTGEDDAGKWNKYILLDILPRFHADLLENIASDNFEKFNDMQLNKSEIKEFITKVIKRDWPIVSNEFQTTGIYKRYGISVLQRLHACNSRVFWTEAYEGKYISFRDSCFAGPEDSIISDVLTRLDFQVVKLSKEQLENLQELNRLRKVSHKVISPTLICETLRNKGNVWDPFKSKMTKEEIQENIFHLLRFICKERSYAMLQGVTLVPLLDGNIGTFGEQDYYLVDSKLRPLFKNSGPAYFIDKLPHDLKDVFRNFSELKIKQLDPKGILELLNFELPKVKEYKWVPYSESYPNRQWIDLILSRFTENASFDISNFNKFPLLPMKKPDEKLVQFDYLNPLLVFEEHAIVQVLVKLGVRFTNYRLLDSAHQNLKQCIIQFNDINVMKSIERRVNASKSYQELFRSLSPKDIMTLRTYVNDHLDSFLSMDYLLNQLLSFIFKILFANLIRLLSY